MFVWHLLLLAQSRLGDIGRGGACLLSREPRSLVLSAISFLFPEMSSLWGEGLVLLPVTIFLIFSYSEKNSRKELL
jgi:hypothetical protein